MLGHDPDRSLMIARRRIDVAELNLRARQLLRDVGELGTEEVALPGGRFAVGDRVVVKRNARGLDVSNGERGRVVAVGEHGMTLQCGERRIDLDTAFLLEPTAQGEPSLVHGYAITGYVAQGLTTEQTFVLADVGGTREWLYVAMSRGRQSNRLYIADEDRARDEFAPVDPHRPDAWRRLAGALARSEAQPMALDLVAESAPDRRGDLRRSLAARRTRLDRDNDFGIDR
jgi:ATP-dependent exoDNAse (exonuclease V) alpha subunit